MGWWDSNEYGGISPRDEGTTWGDGPADIVDEAIVRIQKEFKRVYNRPATRKELERGIRFSLSIID